LISELEGGGIAVTKHFKAGLTVRLDSGAYNILVKLAGQARGCKLWQKGKSRPAPTGVHRRLTTQPNKKIRYRI